MRPYLLIVLILLCALSMVALPSLAHEEGGAGSTDGYEDHHVDHMVMWWEEPTLLELIGAYLVLAIPIGLLVYLDARDRGMNSEIWFAATLVPFFGIATPLTYLVVREGHHPARASSVPPSSPSPPPPPPTQRYGEWVPNSDPQDPREEGGWR
jgi:hypothetical protein